MRPNSSATGKRRKNRARGALTPPTLTVEAREACQAALHYSFKSPELLDRALTHRSAAAGHAAEWSNERLEFLGDRVLGLIVSETMLEMFPTAREGDLAPRLNAIVSRETCGRIGAALGLGAFLLIDRAERAAGGADKPTLLANAMEAVLGAIYLDKGLPAARTFVKTHWKAAIQQTVDLRRDPKSALQEWAQGRGYPTPTYAHGAPSGPDHAPRFTASVVVAGLAEADGVGATKQEAERAAARAFLDRQEVAS
jgi:ribonuclease-3